MGGGIYLARRAVVPGRGPCHLARRRRAGYERDSSTLCANGLPIEAVRKGRSSHSTADEVKAGGGRARMSVRNPKRQVLRRAEGFVCLNDRFNLCHLDTIRFSV